jgi:hypothetical protein
MSKIDKLSFDLDNIPNKYLAFGQAIMLVAEKLNEVIDAVNTDNCFVCGSVCHDTTDDLKLPVCAMHKAVIGGTGVTRVRWTEAQTGGKEE